MEITSWIEISYGIGRWLLYVTVAKKKTQNVCIHISSKRIELESPGWSGLFVCFEFSTKPDQPGLSSLIRLEVVLEQS